MSAAGLPTSVFIVGVPRSGTSVFFKTLAAHPDFACTTNLTRRFRANFFLVRIAELLGRRHRPVEAGALWRSLSPWATTQRGAGDLTERQRRLLEQLVRGHTRHFGRPVFLNKQPGLAMAIPWLAAGLPTARFIHVLRDGRAVAHSILAQCRRRGETHWAYMGRKLWPELGEMDSVAYGGAIWSRLSMLADRTLGELPQQRALTVRYEDFVREPERVLDATAGFCGVRWEQQHAALVPRLEDRNRRWMEQMTPEEQERMIAQAKPGLEHFGYA